MAGREEFRADFVVGKNEIPAEAEKAADALDKLSGDSAKIEIDADVSRVLSALDEVAAEAKRTEAAADALSQALGPELTGKADTTALVGDLRAAGLTLEQITANADQLGAKFREISDMDVGGKLGANLGTTRGQMDNLRSSSDQTRSVMANLAGNAAQDLGQLGGVAGSAGVAIGQLAEYAADGNIQLGNLGRTAIPLLGVAAAAKIAGDSMADIKEKAQFRTDQVDRFADSLMEGATAAETLAAELEKVGDLKFETGLGVTLQIRDALGQLGLTVSDFTGLAGKSNDEVLKWANGMKAAGADAGALDQVVVASAYARQQLATADERAAITAQVLGDESSIAKDKIEDQKQATEDAADAAEEAARAQEEQAEAVREAIKAYQEYVGVVKSVDYQEADITGATSAIEGFRDQMFGLTRINADYQTAVDGMTQSLKDNGDTFDLNTEKGRANQEALEGVAAALDLRLVAAYGDANGSLEEFSATSEAAFQQLVADLGLGADQAEVLRDQLNMTPEEVETRFKLSEEAEALQKLELLQTAIGALPTDVQLRIGAMIAEGDIVGAAHLASTSMADAVAAGPPAMFPTGADTSGAVSGVEGVVGAVNAGAYGVPQVPVGADPATASGQVGDFVDETESQQPIVPVDSSIKLALITMAIINLVASQMKPEVTVTANAGPALATLNALQQLRPQVGVAAYLSSYPNATRSPTPSVSSVSPSTPTSAPPSTRPG